MLLPVGTPAPKHFKVNNIEAGSSIYSLGYKLTAAKEVISNFNHLSDKVKISLSF